MDMERSTNREIFDRPSVGFRIVVARKMTGLMNSIPGPEYTDIYGNLTHCTGPNKCTLNLPPHSGELVLSKYPV